jgi:hypothetical protein
LPTIAAGLAIAIPFSFVSVSFGSRIDKKVTMIEVRIGVVLLRQLPPALARAPGAALTPF